MARDFGTILHSLWGDDDWRELSVSAQHLYLQLLSHPALNYAGVTDWKPGRLALASDATASERYDAALELAGARFIILDDDYEEVMVRSFLRHDGVLKKPNVATAMTKAYALIASPTIRGVLVHELRRLKTEFPDWPAWSHPSCAESVGRILKGRVIDPKQILPLDPSPNPIVDPSVKGSPKGSKVDPSLHLPLQLHQPPSKEGATPPSMFCARHPQGTDTPCTPCKRARVEFDKALAEIANRKPAATVCDEHGYPFPCRYCDPKETTT